MQLRINRWLPAGGALFVVLLVILQIALPSGPKTRASAATITAFFLHHHRAGLIAEIVQGIAIMGLVCFVAALAGAIREAGEGLLGAVAYAGGLLMAGLALVGLAVESAVVYRVALEAPGSTKALYVVSIVLFTLIGFPAALLIGATALACWRSRLLPSWYAALSGIAALVVLVGAGALKHAGFYSPDGAYGFIPFAVLLAWTLLTSVLLVRAIGPEPVARPAHAM